MNKAITDGLVFTPPTFSNGLTVWSSQDGTPGSDTYATSGNAITIPADQDFGGCLELLKSSTLTKIRYMGQTPILPGCYLRVTARVKAISGNLPSVRIAAYAAGAGGVNVTAVPQIGPSTDLLNYGSVVTVSAIIGTGARGGVDMAWNSSVIYAHIGLDLTGPNGGLVRIDDLEVEDITGAFLRDMFDTVDVIDFGAIGNGVADDTAAFQAADAAAQGRAILVPEGVYKITSNLTINNPIRFIGRLEMADESQLSLLKNFELNSYIDALGSEVAGFKKAVQALFNFTDHEALDMMGRRIELTEPIDIQAAIGNKDSYANRRMIRNGQFNCVPSAGWDTGTVTARASYNSNDPYELNDVENIGAIEIGSLITANTGVGREVYVADKDEGNDRLFLSQPLYDAPGSQNYTFQRFRYALDFSGFTNLQRFVLSDIEILMAGNASGILLPSNGLIFHVKDSFFTGPKDRALTSHATGCQGMLLDRNQFLSQEQGQDVQDRSSIAFNVNKNDCKIRNNRGVKFKHWAIMAGTGHLILGNHFFQGDPNTEGQRTAGIVLAEANAKTILTGNYIDNCYLEWTNEYDPNPSFTVELSFGALSIIGNIFMSSNVAAWYRPIHIKPFGSGHFINGLNITGNVFKQIKGAALDRVDMVDDSFANLDTSRYVDLNVNGNTFHGIAKQFQNPITLPITQNSAATTWTVDASDYLPFEAEARLATALIPEGRIRDNSNQDVFEMPYCSGRAGPGNQSVEINWGGQRKGKVFVTVRADAPT